MLSVLAALCICVSPDNPAVSTQTHVPPWSIEWRDTELMCGCAMVTVRHYNKPVARFYTPIECAKRSKRALNRLDRKLLTSFSLEQNATVTDWDMLVAVYTLGHALHFDRDRVDKRENLWLFHPHDKFMQAVQKAADFHDAVARNQILRDWQGEINKP